MTLKQRDVSRKCVGFVLMMVVAGGLVNAAEQVDWPRFRGPDANGISTESNWNPEALKAVKVAWKKNLGKGFSSVALKGEYLYTMGNVNNEDIVCCLKAADGAEVWTHKYQCKAGDHPGPRATPALDGDCVYTLGKEGHLFCLNAADGKVKWQKNLVSDFGAENLKWGFSGSVYVHGDMLLANARETGIALKKDTGDKIWASQPSLGGYSTPVVYKSGDKECVALFGQKAAYGVDLKTGAKLWSYKWETSWDVNAADPIVVDRKVFITSGYGKGSALLDITGSEAKEIWQNKTLCSQFSSVVLLDGHLYGIDGNTGGGVLRCLDFASGAQKWEKRLGFGALMAAAGKLIVLNETGDLYIAKAITTGYEEVSSTKGLLGKVCWTAPVLCRGIIYCRNGNGDLVAVDVAK